MKRKEMYAKMKWFDEILSISFWILNALYRMMNWWLRVEEYENVDEKTKKWKRLIENDPNLKIRDENTL